MIQSFQNLTEAQLAQAGGKGATLARLLRAGYPVPPGFVILPAAFVGDTLSAESWQKAQIQLADLRNGHGPAAFAVRSSAASEDSARASFAGEFESVLGVTTEAEIQQAIEAVRASRHSGRAVAYSAAQGVEAEHDMAVVVQQMVAADYAGVLFTADPVTGSRTGMIGNYVRGTGDRLVSGEANPFTFTLARPNGRYAGPPEIRLAARHLYDLAARLEEELGGPQDIEWAIKDGRVWLLQARPITTLQDYDPRTGAWNDSLTGDYLWSNGNFGEALPDVMTPYSWSVFRTFFRHNGVAVLSGVPMGGNLGGRAYVNLSLLVSITDAFRLPRKWILNASGEVFGRLPPGLRIPTIPLSFWWALRALLPWGLRRFRTVRAQKERVPSFIANTPATVDDLTRRIASAASEAALLTLWHAELSAHTDEAFRMLAAGTSDFKNLQRALHGPLIKLVGEADANALMSGMGGAGDLPLASLGPVVGLSRVARGEQSRDAFARQFGHRSPHELELSEARPGEDPAWLDRLAEEAGRNPVSAETLLGKRRAEHQAAWERFTVRYPSKARDMRRKLDALAQASRTREATRSEFVRMMGVFRAFALRAGDLSGLGVDIFLLTIEEVVSLLAGERGPLAYLPARRATDTRQRALPPYPALIAGRFDPAQWAADPHRRSDAYDSQAALAAPPPSDGAITGYAGAAGVVEGVVRLLQSPDEGAQLQAGEVLVTTTTNVGWTPLFPRAAAIVTDVGAPLSHAAIVARELGIPAVVGTGDATMRLKTGDRVRVDGGRGVVEVVSSA